MAFRTRPLVALAMAALAFGFDRPATGQPPFAAPFNQHVGVHDWPQLGGSPARNNVVPQAVPTDWEFNADRRAASVTPGRNVKWAANLGSVSYGTPVVANGQIYVGTNNTSAYLKVFPARIDLGCMLCFRAADGEFMWQYSSPKLPTGRVHDWPMQGICSTPVVEGERMWFVSNRGEVVCLDTEGFRDQEDDGLIVDDKLEIGYWPIDLSDLQAPHLAKAFGPLFARAKQSWPRYVRTKQLSTENEWLVSSRGRNLTDVFRLRRVNQRMEVYKANDDQKQPLFEFETNLRSGLDQGKLSTELAYLLNERGIELPANSQVNVIDANKQWELITSSEHGKQSLLLEVSNGLLYCYKQLSPRTPRHADVVWRLDMMNQLGVRQHNMANCSPTIWGDLLFVCTSNGVDESHLNIPAPDAPSFLCIDKRTGEVIWQDNSPGAQILHGQWASPTAGMLGGVPQVIFAGGDGYLRSFRADRGAGGKPTLLWKFDCNAKDSKWELGGRGTRNNIVATPVIYRGKVYAVTGQDPEHGEGPATLWCIDPTRRGDVSPEMVLDSNGKPAPPNRVQALPDERQLYQGPFDDWESIADLKVSDALRATLRKARMRDSESTSLKLTNSRGDQWKLTADGGSRSWKIAQHQTPTANTMSITTYRDTLLVKNPNSAAIWKYDKYDLDHDGEIESHETMHRSIASPVLRDGLLFQSDFSGYVHCLNAETGKPYWIADTLATCWSTPLIAGNHVYVPDEDGDIAIFGLSADPNEALLSGADPSFPAKEINMETTVHAAPVVADGVLYVATRNHLFAIEAE